MASTGKCPFCGQVVTSDQKVCPSCGGENILFAEDHPQRIMNPATLEELKEYCAERNMPLLRMRFFIGENVSEARAFGIYQVGDVFTVYKNKSDGSRAIRYSGTDEAYAVGEIHSKLLEECYNRGIYPDGRPIPSAARSARSSAGRKAELAGLHRVFSFLKKHPILIVLIVVLLGLTISSVGIKLTTPPPLQEGYYRTSTSQICHYSQKSSTSGLSNWHIYDGQWKKTMDPFNNRWKAKSSYLGKDYSGEWGATEISFWEPNRGYYQQDDTLFYHDTKWHALRDETWKNNDAPFYDKNGNLTAVQDCWLGTVYRSDWIGCQFPFTDGYYRYQGGLWFYSDQTEKWYALKDKWEPSSWPVNNFLDYYFGQTYHAEWGGAANPLQERWKKGYYRFNGNTLYYTGVRWIKASSVTGTWSDFTLSDANTGNGELLLNWPDYYQGTSHNALWGGKPYTEKGYYKYNGSTYYNNSGTWYKYVGSQWIVSSFPSSAEAMDYYSGTYSYGTPAFSTKTTKDYSRNSDDRDDRWSSESSSSSSDDDWDSDWSSGSYDSWDSNDTDWDSDW